MSNHSDAASSHRRRNKIAAVVAILFALVVGLASLAAYTTVFDGSNSRPMVAGYRCPPGTKSYYSEIETRRSIMCAYPEEPGRFLTVSAFMDGRLFTLEHTVQWQPHGWRVYYHTTGKPSSAGYFVNGEGVGQHDTWSEFGCRRSTTWSNPFTGEFKTMNVRAITVDEPCEPDPSEATEDD